PTRVLPTLSLHDALPIWRAAARGPRRRPSAAAGLPPAGAGPPVRRARPRRGHAHPAEAQPGGAGELGGHLPRDAGAVVPALAVQDRKSTRLNSSHVKISY